MGLAFSGGGIRSATFNLGVLKALHELGLLKHTDYLATVSGGGYIGAWWTAWRARWGGIFPETLPSGPNTDVSADDMNREPEEVRHLREFSNFLSPRIGFFESEMWNAVLAVVSAVLPALLVTIAIITLAFSAWLAVMFITIVPWEGWNYLIEPIFLSGVIIGVQLWLEKQWCNRGVSERQSLQDPPRFAANDVKLVMILLIVAGIFVAWKVLDQCHLMPFPAGVIDKYPITRVFWLWNIGIPPQQPAFSFNPHLFDAPIIWATAALVGLVVRLLVIRFVPVSRSGVVVSAIDRLLGRVLASALVVAALGALWLGGCWLHHWHYGRSAAGGALLSGGAFSALRNWMGRLGPTKKGGVMDLIKPLIPEVLAYMAIALGAVCVATVLAGLLQDHQWESGIAGSAVFIVLAAVLFFDPAQVSMHSFYRNRLVRAYLGASNIDALDSRGAISSERNRYTPTSGGVTTSSFPPFHLRWTFWTPTGPKRMRRRSFTGIRGRRSQAARGRFISSAAPPTIWAEINSVISPGEPGARSSRTSASLSATIGRRGRETFPRLLLRWPVSLSHGQGV